MLTAIILAGGESSRLRPLGDKSLQKFMGQTLLEHHLRHLGRAGVGQCIVVTNAYNAEVVQAECTHQPEMTYTFVTQPAPLGMGDAVARALAVAAPDAPVYLTQAHDLFTAGFHRTLIAQVATFPETILLAARRVREYFPGGYLVPATAEQDDRSPFAVHGIIEKPSPGSEPSNWVTLVAHSFPRAGDLARALDRQGGGSLDDWYERALTSLIAQKPALAIPHHGVTASLKYPWQMLDIMEMFLSRMSGPPQIHPSALIDPAAVIRGPVVVEEGARIFAGAIIQGPAYIGRDAVIGNATLVRESMLGARTVVGFNCEVARSWVGDDVWFHTSYIGDSVIDDDVMFGYGSVTSNTRLDEEAIKVTVKGERISTGRLKLGQIVGRGTRIGVNAAMMPGCVIGRHALIGPGVVLREDVPDDTRITVRQDLQYAPNTIVTAERGAPPAIPG